MTTTTAPLPSSTEAEKSILSSMMGEESYYFLSRAAEAGLVSTDFYLPSHQTLHRILTERQKAVLPIEPISLTQQLRDLDILEQIGGPSEITSIYTAAPTAAHFDHHLGLVRTKSLQRQALEVIRDGLATIHEALPDTAETAVTATATQLAGLLQTHSSDHGDLGPAELLREFSDFVEKSIEGPSTDIIPTPWDNLNAPLGGGLGRGEITFVAARPSMGKTAFALQILEHATANGTPAQFLSIESSTLRLTSRLIARRSGVDLQTITRGKFTRGNLQGIKSATGTLLEHPFRIRKMHGPTAGQVAAAIRRAVREHGCQLVVIDYLQIIRASNSHEQSDIRLRIDNALDTICPLAGELNIALVILAQLNRDAESMPAINLHLGMLKESSRIEQDADTVLMIGPGHNHEPDGEDRQARTVNIPKNRDGETSFSRLQFHGPTTTFHTHSI